MSALLCTVKTLRGFPCLQQMARYHTSSRINQPKPRPETLVMATRQTGDRNMEVSPYTSTPRPLFLVNPRLASANQAETRYLVHLAGSQAGDGKTNWLENSSFVIAEGLNPFEWPDQVLYLARAPARARPYSKTLVSFVNTVNGLIMVQRRAIHRVVTWCYSPSS